MDYYIVQKEEMEIDSGLANRLVDFLVLNLQIPKIDAQVQIKHFPGIMKISGKEETQNLSQAFRAAGLDNFIIEEKEFIPLPKREPITGKLEETIEAPGLIAPCIISKKIEQTTTSWNPFKVRGAFALPLIYDSGVRENKKTKVQKNYYINIITRQRRWELARLVFPEKEIKVLEDYATLNTYLTKDMRKMFQGQEDIKVFTERKYYNEYLTWLMQVVYAKRCED